MMGDEREDVAFRVVEFRGSGEGGRGDTVRPVLSESWERWVTQWPSVGSPLICSEGVGSGGEEERRREQDTEGWFNSCKWNLYEGRDGGMKPPEGVSAQRGMRDPVCAVSGMVQNFRVELIKACGPHIFELKPTLNKTKRMLVNNKHPKAIFSQMSHDQKKWLWIIFVNKSKPVWNSWLQTNGDGWCIIHIWCELRKLAVTFRPNTTESQYVNATSYGRHVIWINKTANVRWRGKKVEIKSTCFCHLYSHWAATATLNWGFKGSDFPSAQWTFSSVSTVSHSPASERERKNCSHPFSNHSSREKINAIPVLFLIPYKNTV